MSALIQIDTSNLRDVLNSINSRAKVATHRALAYNLTRHANKLANALNRNAPSQWRTDDNRYKTKLSNSFYAAASGDARTVYTLEPRKLSLVSNSTDQHEIKPRYKKALWWPGLDRPIAYVSNHPGTNANDFVQRTLEEVSLTPDPQMLADMIVSAVTGDESAGSAWEYYGMQTTDFSEWGGPKYD